MPEKQRQNNRRREQQQLKHHQQQQQQQQKNIKLGRTVESKTHPGKKNPTTMKFFLPTKKNCKNTKKSAFAIFFHSMTHSTPQTDGMTFLIPPIESQDPNALVHKKI